MISTNKIYWQTKLKKEDIILFSHFLGFWDPENSNIWFIWNEERLFPEESLEERINTIRDSKKSKLYDKKNYFTKYFYDYQDKNNLWSWYEIMRKLIPNKENLEHVFISEFYFLPSDKWNNIAKEYWFSEVSRNSCYLGNIDLNELLRNRLETIFQFLTESSKKVVYFYSYQDRYLEEKLSILKELFSFENEQKIWNNWIILTYNKSNTIYICKLLPNSPINS